MRKAWIFLAGILLWWIMAGEAAAQRSGGTFNFCVPYGGDLSTLDAHRSPAAKDLSVAMNIH